MFLNRRGFAPLTLVQRLRTSHGLPELRFLAGRFCKRRLVCHHCGYSMPPPEQCPKCEAKGSFVAVVPASNGWSRRRPSCFSGAPHPVLSSDLVDTMERLGRN